MGVTTRVDTRLSGRQGVQLNFRMYISDCPACGVLFGITEDYEDERRRDAKDFYCPNGHVMSWSESEAQREKKRADRLAKEKARLEEQSSFYQQALRDEREGHKTTAKQLASTKGQLTKTRKRAAAALCPAGCKRHFVQMERHLQSKHPQWSPETSNALESR